VSSELPFPAFGLVCLIAGLVVGFVLGGVAIILFDIIFVRLGWDLTLHPNGKVIWYHAREQAANLWTGEHIADDILDELRKDG